jgi:hypothetical protein
VTFLSCFAYKDYFVCHGKGLQRVDDWYYVAMADDVSTDARKKPSYNQQILSWFETPVSN